MLIRLVDKLDPIERFLYWVKERHEVYLKKSAGHSKPYTDDEILQQWWFTNPYRENDKVTRWFREIVREPLRDVPEVIFATICFRWFNRISTGELLQEHGLLTDWSNARAIKLLREVREKGNTVFTGAFVISNSASSVDKVGHVCGHYINPVWLRRADLIDALTESTKWRAGKHMTMQEAHHHLTQSYPGFGGTGFMAYEVVCDLRYTYVLENAPDKETWSNPGPGAKRGLNRLLGRELDTKVPDKLWVEWSGQILKTMQTKLKHMPHFEMREVEHSLCEFDKYERALDILVRGKKTGNLKRRYEGKPTPKKKGKFDFLKRK